MMPEPEVLREVKRLHQSLGHERNSKIPSFYFSEDEQEARGDLEEDNASAD